MSNSSAQTKNPPKNPIERGVYVAVGAADLAAEKFRSVAAIDNLRKFSVLEHARELEPRIRKQADELQARGENAVRHLQVRRAEFRKQVGSRGGRVAELATSRVGALQSEAAKLVRSLRGNDEPNGAEPKPRAKTTRKPEVGTIS